jgi:nicotinamidase-related amidase
MGSTGRPRSVGGARRHQPAAAQRLDMSMSASFSASPSILVCCNLQDDCSPADTGAALATAACSALLARWRGRHWPVAHLKRLGERQWLKRGAGGPEWVSDFKPRADELTFVHQLPSAYSSAHFEQYLQTLRDTACVLIGYSLDETILATAVDGFHRSHRYYLAPDAVACRVPKSADADTYRRAVVAVIQKFSGTFRTAEELPPPSAGLWDGRDRSGPAWESTTP